MSYLSKSNFVLAHDCPTKLYYKKKRFPSSKDTDEYLKFLAKGGYAVGKLATLYYPEGIEIKTGNPEEAVAETNKLLQQENVTIFEAAVLSKNKLVRVDILEKKGDQINLIEVKSKSFNPRSRKGIKDISNYEDVMIDIGFQYITLKEYFPNYSINPYLFLPDKSKYTEIEGLSFNFLIKEVPTESNFRKYEVEVNKDKIPEITNESLLILLNVEEHIKDFLPTIRKELETLLPSIENGIAKIETPLTKKCFSCEYTLTNGANSQSGFDVCWKEMPNPEHHLKDITRVGNTSAIKSIDTLINQKLLSIDNISDLLDSTKKSDYRRKIQIEYTKQNKTYLDPQLKRILNSLEYPLHFIDFETTRVAIPYHNGMRPYEQLAFQWSCHTINRPGDEPVHSEWLNLKKEYPNFEFAESLMNQIGETGTPFMWSPHENTTLKDIYRQLLHTDYSNNNLKEWLERIIKFRNRNTEDELIADHLCETEGRFIDLHALAREYYFHPLMKGKTSIKKVLPAVLSNINSSRIENWLKNFEDNLSLYGKDSSGLVDPYKLLPPLEIYEEAEKAFGEDDGDSYYVNEGTGAMTAYQDIMIGLNAGNDKEVERYAEGLKRYCKLDTLAMLIIWEYWRNYEE